MNKQDNLMLNIIKWLMEFESLAGRFYYEASKYYSGDKKLNDFLIQSTREESYHYQIMEQALKHSGLIKEKPVLSLDDATKSKMESPILIFMEKIKSNDATLEDLIDCIFETEFSEWNDLFLYIVNSLKEEVDEFCNLPAKIQNHMRNIQFFLESYPYGKKRVKKLKEIRNLFTDKILIVEDNRSISQLLSAVLSKEGHTDKAYNGKEALMKISENNYSVILSDVGMPVMNGFDFYKKASEKYSNIGNKFIFYTASLHKDRISFFEENNLKYLIKPSPVKELRAAITETILEVNSNL